ncbi:MAG: glycosyltransferase family 4 protein [Methylobacterium sp.]|uniref:glycosyltransferase family 4 protein n=1 Tax=Methylobacterium sp. TaxID=409 RepID=UPI0025ED76E7|nr:glycosyltransferase family 4 protein [Methylobacterium sp.]MBX9930007.1 glycosyltransferase family 4 protein [Methylobacterium sp.]
MKIALVAHLKYPIAQPFSGGLEMHTHFLACALQARGHSVTLFASQGSRATCQVEAVCSPTGTAIDDASALRIDAEELAAYERIMDRIAAGGFDFVHNNSLHPLPLFRAAELSIPMVTALHTPPFEPFVQGVRARADDMVFAAVSESLAEEWRPVLGEMLVIGNGIDLDAFAYRPRASGQTHAIWTGRIVPEKGPHLAIDAARAAGLPLVFAGPVSNTTYWTDEILPRLGPDVTYLGHLSHDELAQRVGEAHVAICTPRWEEPFGLVVAEAIACGTPVAAFARGAIPDILDGSCGALAVADDVADLGRAIRVAVDLDRHACRRRAEHLFDAHTMIDRYEALYRGEIGRGDAVLGKAKRNAGRTPVVASREVSSKIELMHDA